MVNKFEQVNIFFEKEDAKLLKEAMKIYRKKTGIQIGGMCIKEYEEGSFSELIISTEQQERHLIGIGIEYGKLLQQRLTDEA